MIERDTVTPPTPRPSLTHYLRLTFTHPQNSPIPSLSSPPSTLCFCLCCPFLVTSPMPQLSAAPSSHVLIIPQDAFSMTALSPSSLQPPLRPGSNLGAVGHTQQLWGPGFYASEENEKLEEKRLGRETRVGGVRMEAERGLIHLSVY